MQCLAPDWRGKNQIEMKTDITFLVIATLSLLGTVFLWRRLNFIVPEGFYGLLYFHGKSRHRLSPGRHQFWKHGYSVRLVDMRRTALIIAAQHVASADKTGLQVSAVLTYQIIQAETAMHEVQDYLAHLQVAAQLAVRSVIGSLPAEGLSNGKLDIGRQLLAQVGPAADKIGIVVYSLELTELNIEPNNTLVQAAKTTIDFETAD